MHYKQIFIIVRKYPGSRHQRGVDDLTATRDESLLEQLRGDAVEQRLGPCFTDPVLEGPHGGADASEQECEPPFRSGTADVRPADSLDGAPPDQPPSPRQQSQCATQYQPVDNPASRFSCSDVCRRTDRA